MIPQRIKQAVIQQLQKGVPTVTSDSVDTDVASIDGRRQETTGPETINLGDYATPQDGLLDLPKTIDHEVTIQIPNGTYGELFVPQFSMGRVNDSGSLNAPVVFEGDPTTPTNVQMDAPYFSGIHGNEAIRIDGIEFTDTSSINYNNASLTVAGSAKVNMRNVVFSDASNALAAVESRGCFLQVDSNVDVAGEVRNFAQIKGGGKADLTDGSITVSGTINDSAAIAAGGTVVSIAETLITNNGGPLPRPKGEGQKLLYDPNSTLTTNSLNPAHIQQPKDVSGSRSLGTWEQNGSGKRLKVMVTVSQGSNSDLAEAAVHINSTNTDNRVGLNRGVPAANGDSGQAMVTFEVPAGYYYKVSGKTGNGILEWREQVLGIVPA
jgi:hypothetical protein